MQQPQEIPYAEHEQRLERVAAIDVANHRDAVILTQRGAQHLDTVRKT